MSQILRLFGASIKFIKLEGTHKDRPVEIFLKGQRIILDLVSRYCSGTLIELNISQCDLTGEIEITIRPLLLHLQKLIINECRYSQLFGQMLSKWSPDLRELQFSYDFIQQPWIRGHIFLNDMQFRDVLHQSFPKLTLISFRSIHDDIFDDIQEFLKLNPQLKKIGLVDCPNISGNIFQSIVAHVPGIESIEIDRVNRMNDSNSLKYCGRMNCLNTLKLCTFGFSGCSPIDHAFIPSLSHEIHAAKIALQHLYVYGAE